MPIRIGSAADIVAAKRKVVAIGDLEIAVFHVRDRFVAWRNECPHMGGPVCQGGLYRRVIEVLDDERNDLRQEQHPEDINIVCPWHGVEFDLLTGQVPSNPKLALASVKVEILDGDIWLHV